MKSLMLEIEVVDISPLRNEVQVVAKYGFGDNVTTKGPYWLKIGNSCKIDWPLSLEFQMHDPFKETKDLRNKQLLEAIKIIKELA